MSSQTVHQLLEHGQRSGLFSEAAAQGLLAQLTTEELRATHHVAARMVEMKVLTAYQAEQLLAGRAGECTIAGRYRILEKLGEGGMGAVYKAHDTQLDRDVAVTVLPERRLNDADAIARFQREARALARLSHPNIIQAHDSGVDNGRHFLVMEYVAGASLAAVLREQGAVPPTLAADMIHQAALGLQHAHEKGLVHRDVKPGNLLLSRAESLAGPASSAGNQKGPPPPQPTTSHAAASLRKGTVKVLDLGLARFLLDQIGDAPLTQEGIGVGTPDYMAPEQFRDALRTDARTDIYSLGCTLYQLIGGTVPFLGSSCSEKAYAHAKKEPVPLEERCPEVPAGLAFVVSKMMAKHPADRFQTAAEVAEALAPYVAGGSHSMAHLRQTARFHAGQLTMRTLNRRRRIIAWAGAAVAAACFTGLLALAWPSILPPSRNGLTNGPPSLPLPGPAAPEAVRPRVITIPEGLTVAKDGTGQYTTIGEALNHVKPRQKILVLDDATYREELILSEPTKHAQITLEASKGAVIELGPSSNSAIVIRGVPGVRVRGFHFRDRGERDRMNEQFILVRGHAPGVVLEGLTLHANAMVLRGITLEYVTTLPAEEPVTVRRCQIQGGADGVWVGGPLGPELNNAPASGILISENRISGTKGRGVQFTGKFSRCQITANLIWNIGMFGLQFEDLESGSDRLLVANNTVFRCNLCFDVWENEPWKKYAAGQVEVRNNLFFDAGDCDLAFVRAKLSGGLNIPVGGGDGKSLVKLWKFGQNHRDQSGRRRILAVPLGEADQIVRPADLPSLKVGSPAFLRPARDSLLATGGAGGDLPPYVGAVPPEGAQPWDWNKTWSARLRKAAPGKDVARPPEARRGPSH